MEQIYEKKELAEEARASGSVQEEALTRPSGVYGGEESVITA